MNIKVGDMVQIKEGAVDLSNGRVAKKGLMFCEDSPLWAEVTQVVEDYQPDKNLGIDKKVQKIVCSKGPAVVWEVQDSDISNNIKSSDKESVKKTLTDEEKFQKELYDRLFATVDPNDDKNKPLKYKSDYTVKDLNQSTSSYVPTKGSDTWANGSASNRIDDSIKIPDTATIETKELSEHPLQPLNIGFEKKPEYEDIQINQSKNATNRCEIDSEKNITSAKLKNLYDNNNYKKYLNNEIKEEMQNKYSFPYYMGTESEDQFYYGKECDNKLAAKYDYRFIPGDTRYSLSSKIEDKLTTMRTALGIPVHGNNITAKSMKFYMYNRFQVPDINMAYNKTFTYVFFTRPDLNILNGNTANSQCINHSETSMIWRKSPELFKMLTDRSRCGDSNNFNLLLSNQVLTFDLSDEKLNTAEAGKTWNDEKIVYGNRYTGRSAGEFSCSFAETSELSVIQLMKLWITYIDNVRKGAWSPSYDLLGSGMERINSSYVYTKTIDYAASAYVFICGPDGEDVLFWSKYYGVFPTNTGISAFQMDKTSSSTSGTPKINITFAYSRKVDMSSTSLMEFNNNANVTGDSSWIPAYNTSVGHSTHPYVRCPYIEMTIGSQNLKANDISHGQDTHIRLKFLKDNSVTRSDKNVFRSPTAGYSTN